MAPTLGRCDYEIVSVVRQASRRVRPMAVQSLRASVPNSTVLRLGCAMVLEGH